jgi:HSP20 family protein
MPVVHVGRTPELSTIHSEMNRLFSTVFDTPTTRGAGNGAMRRWIPAMDLIEADEHFVVKADLPGMTTDDVKVEIEDNVLKISGERKTELEDKHEGFYRLERTSGSFSRALTLPEGIDPAAVTATFADGVLDVRFPKPVEAAPHRVEITVGATEPQAIEADAAATPSDQ